MPALTQALTYSTAGGNDTVIYDGNYAYRSVALTFSTGDGNNLLFSGAGTYHYVGTVNVHAGAGDDRFVLGSLQGNTSGTGGQIHGGDGNDLLKVRHNDLKSPTAQASAYAAHTDSASWLGVMADTSQDTGWRKTLQAADSNL